MENSHPLRQMPSHADEPNSCGNWNILLTFFSYLDKFLTFLCKKDSHFKDLFLQTYNFPAFLASLTIFLTF